VNESFVGQWPSGQEHWVPTLLQLTIPAESGRAVLGSWFELGFDSLAGDLRSGALGLPDSRKQSADERVSKVCAALFSVRLESTGYYERRTEFSSGTWRDYLSELEELPHMASLELFTLDDDGIQVNPSMLVSSHRYGRAGEWLSLDIMVKPQLQPEDMRWPLALSLLKSTADAAVPSHGSVSFYDTIFRTPLELSLHLAPEDTVPRSREQLRGYGWITILGEEMGIRFGGEAGLRKTGAFAEVVRLTNGGYWLKATPTLEEYRALQAEKVRLVLAPVLPNAGHVQLEGAG
jgi:hypothetical protein